MESYSTWCKYKNEAALYLLRWSAEFTKNVWMAVSDALKHMTSGDNVKHDYITAALLNRKQAPTALADLAARFSISEKQVWALLIDQAEPMVTSLDRLSDARDQVRKLTAQEDFAEQQRLHANFNKASEFREHQSARAKQPRIKIGDGQNAPTLSREIERLAQDRQYEELSAKQLWPIFLGVLDQYHLDPVEDTLDPLNSRCTYHLAGKSREISFKRFSNAVAAVRKKKSH